MNIAHFYGHSGANGVTASIQQLFEHLVARGHTVHCFCRTDSALTAYPSTTTYRYLLGWHTFALRRRLRAELRARRIDILNVHSQRDGRLAINVAHELGIPVCYTCHELSALACGDAPLADGVIAVSAGVGAFLREQYAVPDDRLHVVPNGVHLESLPSLTRGDARTALGATEDEVWLGFLGRIVGNKNVGGLVMALAEALPRAPQLRLAVIGSGSAEQTISQMIARQGLGDRVRMLGWMPHAQALTTVAALDALVLPSLAAEGLSISVLEAMGLGVPALASDLPSLIGGPIRHGETGWLFDPKDTAEFAEALVRLAASGHEARRAIGEAARREIAGHYRFDQVVDRVETAYANIIARGVLLIRS